MLIAKIMRTLSWTLFPLCLAVGISDTASGHHDLTTYTAWYGLAGVFLATAVGLTVWIARLKAHEQNRVAPARQRTGYVGRAGSTGDFTGGTFSESLDVGIDNAGRVIAREVMFGSPANKHEERRASH